MGRQWLSGGAMENLSSTSVLEAALDQGWSPAQEPLRPELFEVRAGGSNTSQSIASRIASQCESASNYVYPEKIVV